MLCNDPEDSDRPFSENRCFPSDLFLYVDTYLGLWCHCKRPALLAFCQNHNWAEKREKLDIIDFPKTKSWHRMTRLADHQAKRQEI